MKLIKPSFEILTQESGTNGLLKHIEKCARTAYKSENKITEDSAAKFVQMLIDKEHRASLEHGSVYLKFNVYQREIYFKYCYNKYSSIKSIGNAENTLNSLIKNIDENYFYARHNDKVTREQKWFGYVTTNYRVLIENNWLDDLQYQCEPTEYHEKRISVKFICDRGVSHEFVRHRTMSFTQESTRYCNYSKDKFDNQVTFILPEWLREDHTIDNPNHGYLVWYDNLIEVEENYKQLLKDGWTPQQARSVLPNALKTELVMTGFISDWQHFFSLRCAPDAHPDARVLAIPLKEEFIKLGYINE